MKTSIKLHLVRAGALAALLAASSAQATVYSWDTTSTGLWAAAASPA